MVVRHLSPGVAVRRAGIEATSPGDRRRVELAIRVAVVGAIAFQVFQRVVNNGYGLSPYGRSLWYVSYEFGFIRRGLAGELLRRAVGRTPTVPEVALVQNAIAVLTVCGGVWLVLLLLRQRTVIGSALAALLAISPFGFDFVGGSKRPDLVAFIVLALVSVWAATRAREPVVVGLVTGALLAVSVLFSEAGPLVVGPWVVLVIAALARVRGRSRWETHLAMAASIVPSLLVLGVVALTGRATLDTKAALEHVAPLDVGGRGTVFPYLDDTVADSVGKVAHNRPVFSLVVGAVLVALVAWLTRRLGPYARDVWHWALPTTALRRIWIAGLATATALLFGLGFDWMRWTTSIAFSASLAAGAITLIVARTSDRPPGSADWFRPVPGRVALSLPSVAALGVAVYLLVLPPLPAAFGSFGRAAHHLMNAPGT